MIELEYWWMVMLPLFFVFGWVTARFEIKRLLTESSTLPTAYFTGLNYLIKGQPDAAIASFREATQTHHDSLELNFALGSLYRLRGDLDQAIRLHHSLLERPQLSELQHSAIVAELAQDYLKSGLFDRSRALLHQLSEHRQYQQASLNLLVDIYVRERDWPAAITTSRVLQQQSGVLLHKQIAQFYCELALLEHQHQQPHLAHDHLQTALQENPACMRASIILGDLAWQAGESQQALQHWTHIEQQNPQYLSLVTTRILDYYRQQNDAESGLARLTDWMQHYRLTAMLPVIYDNTCQLKGAAAANVLMREALGQRGDNLHILGQWLHAKIAETLTQDPDLPLIQQSLQSLVRQSHRYHCRVCGFRAREYFWQCIACHSWESVDPEHTPHSFA